MVRNYKKQSFRYPFHTPFIILSFSIKLKNDFPKFSQHSLCKKDDFNGILLFYKKEFPLIFHCLLYAYMLCYACVLKTFLTTVKEIFIVSFCCRKKIGYKYQSEFLLIFFSRKKVFTLKFITN